MACQRARVVAGCLSRSSSATNTSFSADGHMCFSILASVTYASQSRVALRFLLGCLVYPITNRCYPASHPAGLHRRPYLRFAAAAPWPPCESPLFALSLSRPPDLPRSASRFCASLCAASLGASVWCVACPWRFVLATFRLTARARRAPLRAIFDAARVRPVGSFGGAYVLPPAVIFDAVCREA